MRKGPWYKSPVPVYRRDNGSLFLEEVRLSDLLAKGLPTPFFVYSAAQLSADWQAYAQAVAGAAPGAAGSPVIAYAVKANNNPVLMQRLRSLGAGATVVSAEELRHAQKLGFAADKLLLHGSGKRSQDLDAALTAGALLSLDSEFDLTHLLQRAAALGRSARVLLRVNPNIDPRVHPYICTGLLDSKFGMSEAAIEALRPRLRGLPQLAIAGLHCHLGSTLRSAEPVRDAARLLTPLLARLRGDGHPIDTLDIGGGLGIDYQRGHAAADEPALPTPSALVGPLLTTARELGLTLWLEPGRSLVGRCGALIGRVIGEKHTASKRFLVVDASMAQLIRPCLYQAYHHIELLEERCEPEKAPPPPCDVVGPVCESADFLGLDRRLGTPREGDGIIVYDAGAYGFAMASRYNMHLLCAEYLIDGGQVRCIRRAETYEDFARTFTDKELIFP